jgi:hypothetical protein
MQHMKNELRTTTSYIPNLEAVIRNAGGVALKVEEPADRVEQPQPGGDGRVLQSGQKKHDEEHGHHLQRVLVAPLHSQEQKDRRNFRTAAVPKKSPPHVRTQLARGWHESPEHLHAVEELGVLVLRLNRVHSGVEHLVPERKHGVKSPSKKRNGGHN